MDVEKPFANYAELETYGLKLRLRSETAALRFGKHIHAFSDKEVRSTLIKGAVTDAVHGMKPLRTVMDLMSGGGTASQLIMGLITRKGGFARRVLGSIAAVGLPNLLAKMPWANVLGKFAGSSQPMQHHQNGTL